jgi:hypothetical protein
MVAAGYSGQVVAENFGITRQRVSQICQEFQDSVNDDAYRDLMRTQAEGVLEDLFKIFRGPGRRVTTPRGPAYEMVPNPETGKLEQDFSRPLYDEYEKVKVADTIVKIMERIGKSYGIDRIKQRERDQSGEMSEFMTWIAELDAQNKALRAQLAASADHREILTAEVVEEPS